ncbi:hypothetical protein B0H16DRAFT_1879246 [Mycena metata]|uniref:Uncharacterized protein n=1 Tax=Mycena metata TaxID=1033252 RepID=A0AAD7NVR7_9AGAR|nr:hypothetical protein B0H16DRAFT_1879246 [Mycena metata]
MKSNSRRNNNTASISSLQSFETIRQAPNTAATSIADSDDHRWSDVVPPDSGLTFAVVWDPEQKDLVSFSSAELANGRDAQTPNSPSDAFDSRSQVLSIGTSAIPPSEYTGTSQFFRQDHNYRFSESKFFPDRPARGRTQTSSTLDGLDVYLRGSMLGRAHNANRYVSCFQDLDGDFAFDPRTSFAQAWLKYTKDGIRDDVSDEGFFESGPYEGMGGDDENEGNMSSAFSVTTTSTSNYINVENEMSDDESANWSALEAPNTPGYGSLFFTGQSPAPPPSRRLHKNAPPPKPASPSDVLERPEYSYSVPLLALALPRPQPQRSQTLPATPPRRSKTPTPAGTPRARNLSIRSMRSLPKFARGLGGKPKNPEPLGWVWIDVKEKDEFASSPSSSSSSQSPLSASPSSSPI